jgi:deoxyribodipyrimidine photo-lyase
MTFPTILTQILERKDNIDPEAYARSRNYIDGSVSYLSPYIARGVISTRQIMELLFSKGYSPSRMEKFLQELAWRDYWQQIWNVKKELINSDLKHPQTDVTNFEMPKNIVHGETGIEAIDRAIKEFYDSGYLHNHLRMYIAALACNNGKSHWKVPAQWMYYHLKDGDWASNALSWQWVAGANSNKKYIANQENINRYCHTNQSHTFLDNSYEHLMTMDIPKKLNETLLPNTKQTILLNSSETALDPSLPTLIYNYYNIDPLWKADLKANRILLLEPSVFHDYPVSEKNIDFAIALAQNIPDIHILFSEFEDLEKTYGLGNFIYKQHPLNRYQGEEDQRDWMFEVKGYYSSFFSFWKKCKKELKTKGLE